MTPNLKAQASPCCNYQLYICLPPTPRGSEPPEGEGLGLAHLHVPGARESLPHGKPSINTGSAGVTPNTC